MKLKWRKITTSLGNHYYQATDPADSSRVVGEAVLTGRYGVDNYPWEWYLDIGIVKFRSIKTSGTETTLRACKDQIANSYRLSKK